MKKLIIILVLLFIPTVYAIGDLQVVDYYKDNRAYDEFDELITNTWAYDMTSKKYVKVDESGNVTQSLDDPTKDPYAKHGRIVIKANMPDNLKDETIVIRMNSIPYRYTFKLNKENNFQIDQEIIEATYEVSYLSIENHAGEYSIDFPQTMSIYRGKTTNLELDYSPYKEKEKNKKKQEDKDRKKLILYICLGVLGIITIIVVGLFIKARNI